MSGTLNILATSKGAPPTSTLDITSTVTGNNWLHVASASGNTNGTIMFSATATGGTPPYSHLWTRRNGDAGKSTLQSPAGNTAYLSWSGLNVGDWTKVVANCKVTDALGNEATSSMEQIIIQRDS